ncbi:hypothetical protein [Aliikangiella sp. IMCC44359]|uniref:hypothetical protein n=1 Tax=Aliikangiella sp. IMCC44359 TaxID=3459125 RepID=UPI00403AD4D1
MSEHKKYVEKVKIELVQWNKEIEVLEAKKRTASAELKKEYQKQIEMFKSKCNEGAEKLKELRKTDDNTWKDVKQGFEHTWNSISDAYHSAKFKMFGK